MKMRFLFILNVCSRRFWASGVQNKQHLIVQHVLMICSDRICFCLFCFCSFRKQQIWLSLELQRIIWDMLKTKAPRWSDDALTRPLMVWKIWFLFSEDALRTDPIPLRLVRVPNQSRVCERFGSTVSAQLSRKLQHWMEKGTPEEPSAC